MAVLVAVAVGLLALPPAGADVFGTYPYFLADSRDHWYCYSGVPSADQFYIAEAMQYLDDRTVMSDSYAGATCGSATDVVWVPGDWPVGTRAGSLCYILADLANRICDQTWIIYDIPQIYAETVECAPDQISANFYANFRKTVRHELGHSVGLAHTALPPDLCDKPTGSDAMTSQWIPTALKWLLYDDHHAVIHIGGHY